MPADSRPHWLRKIGISCLIISIIVVCVPALSVFAAPKDVFATKSAETSPEKSSPTNIDDITLQEDTGLIKDSFKGNGDKLIIHIQDAHCNYEAQNNIAKILDTFMNQKGLVLVAVEGSAGEIDTSLFTTFPDEEIRKEVADYFMKKGKISGAEHLAINTKKPIILYGIENKEYYLENLRAFTDTLPKRPLAKKVCGEIKSYLNKLKNYIYTKELKEFDGKINDYNEDKIKFVDFCVYLNKLATKQRVDLGNFKNFSHLINSLKIEEGIDFNKVNNERSDIINELEKKLSQDQLSDLFLKSLSYRTKKISASEYYTYLKDLAAKNKLELSKFKNFNLYVNYLSTYSKIDNPVLFKELKGLEDDIKEALYTNGDQRKLSKLLKNIRLIEELLDISLSKEDAGYLAENRNEFNSREFTNFIQRQASKYALAYSNNPNVVLIDEILPTLERFYQVAEKREDALLENTLKKMDEEGLGVSALISGGYHTEGLTKRFRDRGISYVVIAPRITDLEAESPYLQILSGEETPLEELLLEETEE